MKKQCFRLTLICLVTASSRIAPAYQMPRDPNYTNFIGMQFVRIEPGQFQMGFTGPNLPAELTEPAGTNPQGDFDEHPAHTVEITRPFYIGLYEVTNLQYELFDPEHKKLRPNAGAESTDDHAVINVNWYDAQAFCKWLSHKENLPYRLPTERLLHGQRLRRKTRQRPRPLAASRPDPTQPLGPLRHARKRRGMVP